MLPSLSDSDFPALTDEQISINGVVMGEGTGYMLVDFNPWDAPEVVATDVALGARPGIISGKNTYKSRAVGFRVFIAGSADTKADTHALGTAIRTAMQPSDTDVPLHFSIAGTQYFMMGRPRSVKADTKRWGAGHLTFECRFLATDPRIYVSSLQYAASSLYTTDGVSGLNFPIQFPLDLKGTTSTLSPPQAALCINNGQISTGWFMAIEAIDSVTGVSIDFYPPDSPTSTQKLDFPSINIPAGSRLLIDSSEHAVLLYSGSGYVGARNFLSADSTWWDLPVGESSFLINVSAGTATATINWFNTEV